MLLPWAYLSGSSQVQLCTVEEEGNCGFQYSVAIPRVAFVSKKESLPRGGLKTSFKTYPWLCAYMTSSLGGTAAELTFQSWLLIECQLSMEMHVSDYESRVHWS